MKSSLKKLADKGKESSHTYVWMDGEFSKITVAP
jgi:hypothetical protein